MAVLFLLALGLITWQALRTAPVLQPAYEFATKAGEQITPMAVPSWRPAPDLPEDVPARRTYLEGHSVDWPGAGAADCQLFLRLSAHHWATRPASSDLLQGSGRSWRRLYLPAESFLDDDDGDGDPLDSGELHESGPGAEAEVFCGGDQS